MEATPEHPLEAASAAAFASSLASGSGGSSDNDNDNDKDDGSSRGGQGANSLTFVTQANTGAARAAASRSTLEQLSERNIGGLEGGGGGGGGGGDSSSRLGSPPSLAGGVSHQPQGPAIV